jgi:hypothetical protein
MGSRNVLRAMKNSTKTSIKLGATGKQEVERLLATVVLGIVDAIREERITPDEGDELFFVPLLLAFMKNRTLNHELIRAVDLATELRGLALLKPGALKSSLDDIRVKALSNIRHTPKKSVYYRPWLVSYLFPRMRGKSVSRKRKVPHGRMRRDAEK